MATQHTAAQPLPSPGQASVTRAVMADLEQREQQGIVKYGTTLQTFNGRNALVDAYQEALDQAQYLKQAVLEREQLAAALQDCRWVLRQMRENYVRGRGLRTGDTKTFLRAEQSVETAWAGLGLASGERGG